MAIERDAISVARAQIGGRVMVRLRGHELQSLRVAGRVHDVGQAQARMEDVIYAYARPATLVRLGLTGDLNELRVLVSGNSLDEVHVRSVAADVRRFVETQGQTVNRVNIPPPGQHPHAGIMGILLLVMSSFGLSILLLSAVLTTNLSLALMASRVREIGLMKTLGARRGVIAAMYLSEFLLIGLLAVVIALPVGFNRSRALMPPCGELPLLAR